MSPEPGDGARTSLLCRTYQMRKGGVMDKIEHKLELENGIFKEIAEDDEDATLTPVALLNEDEVEDEFLQRSVDVDNLATGFSATIPSRIVDMDEDTQGDEGTETNGELLLTPFEVDGEGVDEVNGDEVELDLEDALATGRTVAEAPDE